MIAREPVGRTERVANIRQREAERASRQRARSRVGSRLCRGRTVVDLWRRTGNAANARVATDVDAEAFLDLLIDRYASLG